MPTFQAAALVDFITDVFVAAQTPDDIARYVAQTLINANLMGHDSHGLIRAKDYIRQIRSGRLHPTHRPQIKQQTGAVAVVDCQRGFGQIGAKFGAELARDLAHQHGISAVTLGECNHIGRLGEYAHLLARENLIGILMVGASWRTVTPYGGAEGLFGTNPMAWGVPTQTEPMVLDFATSKVAVGKLMVARDAGLPVPENWVLDKNARPTTDPNEFFDDGMLLPFGNYKGYGLNLMMEIIPVLLGGYAPVTSPDFNPGNATLILALSIEAFTTEERFTRLVDELRARIKQVEAAEGFDEVLLPGEPEARARDQRQRDGIPIPEKTWADICGFAEELGVTVPEAQG